MNLFIETSAHQFLDKSKDYLERDEAANSLLYAVLQNAVQSHPQRTPFMASVENGNGIELLGFYLERNLILSHGNKDGLEMMALELKRLRVDPPGVVGPAELSQKFAEIWSKVRECNTSLFMDQRVYRLTQVTHPTPSSGFCRPVRSSEFDLTTSWMREFTKEALSGDHRAPEDILKKFIGIYIWEFNGQAVSMAGLTRPTEKSVTIGGVYTPKELRKNGFATSLVAEVSKIGLTTKKFCVLYTDLMNPTSNSIYQKIGYTPVCDSRHYVFSY